jgi:peptidyl-prolyl cis-trans isomerase SurA
VSPKDVTEAIENIKKKYSLTDALLEESLKKEGLTLAEYKKRLSEQILIGQFVNHQIKNTIMVSDEDVKSYMKAHKGVFGDEEAFRLSQILFRSPKTDEEKKALEDKASLVMERLKAGEDFSKLAKEYSEDVAAKTGGDTGYIKRSYLAKEFMDALSQMKPGDYSKPFWTDKGLHIIKLDEKVSPKTEDEIRENVRRNLQEAQFSEKYDRYVKGLREKALIEIRL